MTSHVARLYAAAVSVLVFFVAWAAVAAHPWTAPKPDPTAAALAAREQRLRLESVRVKRLVDRRWAGYRAALAARRKAIASAPVAAAAPAPAAAPVRVVTLPAVTITRTS